MSFNGPYIKFDFISFLNQFKAPNNIDLFVEECVQLLCAVQISNTSKNQLKELLLSGQQNKNYWTDVWNKFTDNSDDATTRNVIENRLRLFFQRLMNLPEYQMM